MWFGQHPLIYGVLLSLSCVNRATHSALYIEKKNSFFKPSLPISFEFDIVDPFYDIEVRAP